MKQYKVIHVDTSYWTDGTKSYKYDGNCRKIKESILNMYAKEGWRFIQIYEVYNGDELYLERDI